MRKGWMGAAVLALSLAGCNSREDVQQQVAQNAQKSMVDIKNQVVQDQIAQYEIMKRQGSPMDVCAHAGLVVAAQTQAQNEAGVHDWKLTQTEDCAKAGVAVP